MIPYVLDTSHQEKIIEHPIQLKKGFRINHNDKLLLNFSYLTPNISIEKIFKLLKNINDKRLKVVLIGKKSSEFEDYESYLNDQIKKQHLQRRLCIISEHDLMSNESLDIHQICESAKGIISLDYGASFGQPLLFGIQHKCPILICPKSKLQWLEIEDLGCESLEISTELTSVDIESINYIINTDTNWGEKNYKRIKQFYSTKLLEHLIGSMFQDNS